MEKVDIIVGITSYNNAKTIDHVIRAVDTGLAKDRRADWCSIRQKTPCRNRTNGDKCYGYAGNSCGEMRFIWLR